MKITANLGEIRNEIAATAKRYQRVTDSVTLLAVSKTRSVAEIEQAIAAGQTQFGENYCQEAIEKIDSIKQPGLEWHFIGPIQSNKTSLIADYFDWVHTLDRIKIARRLNDARPTDKSPLNVCIQINISGEESKSGIGLEEAENFADELKSFPNLMLRGLMALPAPEDDLEEQRKPFAQLRECLKDLKAHSPGVDTLSMGTSNDMEAAIAEGATIVRIGTAIFGPRNK